MANKYALNIDKVCPSCNTRNVVQQTSLEPINIALCGRCGDFLMVRGDVTSSDIEEYKKSLSDFINKLIKEGPDALL